MDYRHTEDFARRMEAAAWRAQAARAQLLDAYWRALAAALRSGWHRITGACRRIAFLPEA